MWGFVKKFKQKTFVDKKGETLWVKHKQRRKKHRPLMHEALGTKAQGAVRFSFSHLNTEEEVDTAVKAVREIAAG